MLRRSVGLAAFHVAIAVLLTASLSAQPSSRYETLPVGVILTELHQPIYPPSARMAAIQGDVDVLVHVSAEGTVESVNVATGHAMLKEPAMNSAKASHFECRGCNDGSWSCSLKYQFKIVATDPEQYCNHVLPEMLPPILDPSRHSVIVPAEQEWTCDPVVERRRVRSLKCLYLWKCDVRDSIAWMDWRKQSFRTRRAR
jgi:TonB family protein